MTPAVLEERQRRLLSAGLCVAAFGLVGALGFVQFWKDGSFWIDEASVADSLMELAPLELFGRLVGGQSFPRVYLFSISGLVTLFGYETTVVRALPQLFFWAASAAWMRLLYLRFRDEPAVIVLGTLLMLIPSTWFLYAAMLKPYTLDVLLASVPFLVRDEFYDATLERGEKPERLLALTALGALSYPFALALLSRAGGWWLHRAGRGSFRLSPIGLMTGVGGIALFATLIWASDLRHTQALGDALRSFWSSCLIGVEDTRTLELLDRFAFGWYAGRAEFSYGARLDDLTLWILRLAFVAGFARLLSGAALGSERTGSARGWGSRSTGCCVLIAGMPLASWWLSYPICAGRLTLFAYLPLLLITLEGFSWAARGLHRVPHGRWIALGLAGLLVLWIAPTSFRSAAERANASSPQDLRPLLARTREEPGLPILTTACTRKQIETLPEVLAVDILYIGQRGAVAEVARQSGGAWLLIAPDPYCRKGVRRIRKSALEDVPYHEKGDGAQLFRLRFPPPQR